MSVSGSSARSSAAEANLCDSPPAIHSGRKPPKAAAKAAPAGHAQSKTKPKTCAFDEFPCAGAWP
jgi:hypothetical protein